MDMLSTNLIFLLRLDSSDWYVCLYSQSKTSVIQLNALHERVIKSKNTEIDKLVSIEVDSTVTFKQNSETSSQTKSIFNLSRYKPRSKKRTCLTHRRYTKGGNEKLVSEEFERLGVERRAFICTEFESLEYCIRGIEQIV